MENSTTQDKNLDKEISGQELDDEEIDKLPEVILIEDSVSGHQERGPEGRLIPENVTVVVGEGGGAEVTPINPKTEEERNPEVINGENLSSGKVMAQESKSDGIETGEENESFGASLYDFVDPNVQLGLKEEGEIYPVDLTESKVEPKTEGIEELKRKLEENKARVELVKSAQNKNPEEDGSLAKLYNYAVNYEGVAKEEVAWREEEIRRLEETIKNDRKTESEKGPDLSPSSPSLEKIKAFEVSGPNQENSTSPSVAQNLRQEGNETLEKRENFLNPPIESWDELYEAVRQIGILRGTWGDLAPEETIALLEGVKKGEKDSRLVTRRGGLREVVLQLLIKDLAEEREQGLPSDSEAEVDDSENKPQDVLKESEGIPLNLDEDSEGPKLETGPGSSEPGVGEETAEAARAAFEEENGQDVIEQQEAEKGPRWSDWFKERTKGFLTFGWWEVHQAEKVRMAGKKAQAEISQGANYLEKEENLSHDEAWEEAEKMQEVFREEKKEPESLSKEDYNRVSEKISAEKVIANEQVEETIVKRSLEEIEKRMAGYKGYNGEEYKLPPEKRAEIEQKIRGGLRAVRQGQVEKDMIKFAKMVRESLDQNWYKRYVAGGIEAALGFAGVKWLVVPAIDSFTKVKTVQAAERTIVGAKHLTGMGKEAVSSSAGSPALDIGSSVGAPSPAAVPDFDLPYDHGLSSELPEAPGQAVEAATEATKKLKGSLWQMSKDLLREKGLVNPTDGQIMEVTKQLVADNNVGVNRWGIIGRILDTKMPVGMAIKVGKAALVAARLAGAVMSV